MQLVDSCEGQIDESATAGGGVDAGKSVCWRTDVSADLRVLRKRENKPLGNGVIGEGWLGACVAEGISLPNENQGGKQKSLIPLIFVWGWSLVGVQVCI